MGVLIGGHLGMDVIRESNGGILKVAQVRDGEWRYPQQVEALRNEARFLRVMSDSGFTPDLLREGEGWIRQTDLGTAERMEDGEEWRRNCVKALWTLRRRGVRHGDIAGPNVLCKADWPWLVDWQEAHLIGDPAPQKQPFSDTHLMWRTIAGTISKTTESYDVPRVARRWLAVAGALGATSHLGLPLKDKTFLDLGCFQGDFVAAAACDGMIAQGIDQGGFRTGEDSIEEARRLWAYMGASVSFDKANIIDLDHFKRDVVIMFSTWSYLVRDYGEERAAELLGRVIADCGTFFFENQLKGDGPGPDFFEGDEQVEEYLGRWGDVKLLITIPVWGRPASRSVFKVTHREA